MEKADAEARAEAFDAQLELREELYEGAADRFTDYWGWANGHRLEVIIVVLLVLEFFVMSGGLAVAPAGFLIRGTFSRDLGSGAFDIAPLPRSRRNGHFT